MFDFKRKKVEKVELNFEDIYDSIEIPLSDMEGIVLDGVKETLTFGKWDVETLTCDVEYLVAESCSLGVKNLPNRTYGGVKLTELLDDQRIIGVSLHMDGQEYYFAIRHNENEINQRYKVGEALTIIHLGGYAKRDI